MQGLMTYLWFDDQAVEAAQYYVSVIPNSRIVSDISVPVRAVTFELDGRPYTAFNGGPMFSFTEAVSFMVQCETQDEVDYFWDRLVDGGTESQCGWLRDRWGLSWQVVPTRLLELIGGPDPEGRARATQAMLGMQKIDLAAIEAAYAGE